MKTLFQNEGLNFSSRNIFGDPQSCFADFKFLISYYVPTGIFEVIQNLYYYETDDHYLQVALTTDINSYPKIIARFKRNSDDLKTQLKQILAEYFEGIRYFIGFPSEYRDGTLFSPDEFYFLLQEIMDGIDKKSSEATLHQPELFQFFNKLDLDPQPSGSDEKTWMAICPRCRRHLLMFKKNSRGWMCMYCQLHGTGEEAFEQARQEIEKKKNTQPL